MSSVRVAVDEICDAAIRESPSVSQQSPQIMEEIPAMMSQLKDTLAKLEAAFRI